MNAELRIFLLGPVVIERNGRPLKALPSQAAEALLLYLACQEKPVPRETLAELLWAERSRKQGLTNLRTILAALRRELDTYLLITRQTLGFNHAADSYLDVAEFENRMVDILPQMQSITPLPTEAVKQLQTALDLYRGNFLTGFSLRTGRDFEAWMVDKEAHLHRLARLGFRRLVAHHLANHAYQDGIYYAEKLLNLDPLNEDVQRQMMWLLLRSGQRNAALAHYQNFHHLLANELGVEPEPETTALYERLETVSLPPPHSLPPETTPFVGRQSELMEIEKALLGNKTRLLTILGPGGIGKTRLALAAGRRFLQKQPGRFLDGIYFIPLADINSAENLSTWIANILDLRLRGSETAETQLLTHLNQREMLLILDNLEHLLTPDSLQWLTSLLAQAPDLKLLVTSRERLRLVEERVFDIPGLPYPNEGTFENVDSYDAVKMCVQLLKRVKGNFAPAETDLAAIATMCRLVDGLPLGIELAAGSGRHYSCPEIVDLLQSRFDALPDSLSNRPTRHQNLHIVFDHSWLLLSAAEQQLVRRFVVFPSTFAASAAEAILPIERAELAMLSDKSFLQLDESGRYALHPLLRQYLAEKWTAVPDEEISVRTRHAHYFADQIRQIMSQQNLPTHLMELNSLMERSSRDVMAATLWLARQHDFTDRRLVSLIEVLNRYFFNNHRFEAGKTLYQQLIQAFQEHPDGSHTERWLTAVLASRIALADKYLYAYQSAQKQLERILPQAYELENGPLISVCTQVLGMMAWEKGELDTAVRRGKEALAAVEEQGFAYQLPVYRFLGDVALTNRQMELARQHHEKAFHLAVENNAYDEAASIYEKTLGQIARFQGHLTSARAHVEKALPLAQAKGETWEIVACLCQLGLILSDVGDFQAAGDVLNEAADLAQDAKDNQLVAQVARAKGWLAESQGALAAAVSHYHRSVALLAAIDIQVNQPEALVGEGRVQVRLGELVRAETALHQAKAIFEAWDCPTGVALTLTGFGTWHQASGQLKRAQRLLCQSLSLAAAAGADYWGIQALVELALLLVDLGETNMAIDLMQFARQQTAFTARDAARVQPLWLKLGGDSHAGNRYQSLEEIAANIGC